MVSLVLAAIAFSLTNARHLQIVMVCCSGVHSFMSCVKSGIEQIASLLGGFEYLLRDDPATCYSFVSSFCLRQTLSDATARGHLLHSMYYSMPTCIEQCNDCFSSTVIPIRY